MSVVCRLACAFHAAGNRAHSRSVYDASPGRFQICNSTTTFTQIEEDASKKTYIIIESTMMDLRLLVSEIW